MKTDERCKECKKDWTKCGKCPVMMEWVKDHRRNVENKSQCRKGGIKMKESLNNGFLKVKDLKKLISDIPDDYYVTVTSSETSRHITHITSVGILKSEYENPNMCLSFCCDDHDISEETDYTEKTLYTIYPVVKTIEQ